MLTRSAWLHAREITLLTPSDISEYLSQTHRKATGGLREAYQTAQDPTEWDEGQKAILDQQAAENDDVDELEEEDAEVGDKRKKASASKPKKKAKTEASVSLWQPMCAIAMSGWNVGWRWARRLRWAIGGQPWVQGGYDSRSGGKREMFSRTKHIAMHGRRGHAVGFRSDRSQFEV